MPLSELVALYGAEPVVVTGRLVCFNWSRLIPACIRIVVGTSVAPEPTAWVRAFYRFLDQEYAMKAFTTEVWILAASTEPLWPGGMSHWDIHQKYRVWRDYKEHTVRPLYFGFRVGGRLDAVCRVRRIDHATPIVSVVPELTNVPEGWPTRPATIWHFEPPVKLPNTIRTGGGMYNRRVRSDLDLLLTCQTVQEIEAAMGKRRAGADA